MGRTFRKENRDYDEKQSGRKGKHHSHSNNRKTGGMRIIKDFYDDDDDLFDDEVHVTDKIRINKNGEDVL